MRLFVILTWLWVDREEILRVASSDTITQTTGSGSEVRVLRLDTDDWHILWRVLHDDWVVDRVRGERSIIIDILYLREKEDRRWRTAGRREERVWDRNVFVSILTVHLIWIILGKTCIAKTFQFSMLAFYVIIFRILEF